MSMTIKVREARELTGFLRAALLEDTPAFFDALYDVEGIEPAKMRPMVAAMRDDSRRFFQMAREKLKPVKVDVQSEEMRGTSWVVRFVLDDRTRLEIVVDDLFERDGALHTRDVFRFEVGS